MRVRAAIFATGYWFFVALASSPALAEEPAPAAPLVASTTGELRVQVNALIAEVWLDGERAGYAAATTLVIPVSPGPHVIEVRAAGYEAERREITIESGSAVDLDVSLTRAAPRAPLTQEPPSSGPTLPASPSPRAQLAGRGVTQIAIHEPAARQEPRGKSVSFILGGLTTATMLSVLGAIFVHIPDSPPHQAIGAGMLIGGGALAVGSTLYAVWPQASPTSASLTWRGAF
ncbi:PEGA domain-containing protein [Chondromyces crocatus]|uniref:PEGA domain-containing protein n=1 Tax=Chondromyces crocatus TaxID=52 RepID=A0A0K1E7N8_CHOCO|nr:PEGA domain-containing protein [Chondromyces crocatus]AKT36568.1 uncharacterized protein CMC5_006860 [Chondromyces crocatus]